MTVDLRPLSIIEDSGFRQFTSEAEAQQYAEGGYKKGTPMEEAIKTVDVKKEDKTPKEGYIKEVIGGYGPTNFFYVDSSGISKGIRESEAKRRMEREGIEWRKVKYK